MLELHIDSSMTDEGYVIAYATGDSDRKLKLKVSKGNKHYYYDISGVDDAYPLQMGNGDYRLSLCELITDNRYRVARTKPIRVYIPNPMAPFLHYNQFVPPCAPAIEVAKGLQGSSRSTTITEIKRFMYGFTYDYVRSLAMDQRSLPDVDRCFKWRRGTCLELASLAAGMLRECRIPTRLVIGHMGKQHHSWCEIYNQYRWRSYDPALEIQDIQPQGAYHRERFY